METWFSEQIDKMTKPLTKPIEAGIERFTNGLAEGPIGRFMSLIGDFIGTWTDKILSFVDRQWEGLGQWINDTFLSNVEVESDQVIKSLDTPSVNEIVSDKGYVGDYDKVISETTQTFTKGWGRVIEYSGDRIGSAFQNLGEFLNLSPVELEEAGISEEARKRVAEQHSKAVYDAVYREFLISEIGMTTDQIDKTLTNGPLEYSFDEENAPASRAAAAFASRVSGVDIIDNEVIPRGTAGAHEGMYGHILAGGSSDSFYLGELETAAEATEAGKQRYAIQKEEFAIDAKHKREYDDLPETFRNALEPKQIEAIFTARRNGLFSDEEFQAFINSDLSTLTGQLVGDDKTTFDRVLSSGGFDVEHDSGEWSFTGKNGDKEITGAITMQLPVKQSPTAARN